MVGPRYFVPPIATYQVETLSPQSKGLVLWMLEGMILSRQEREYLANWSKQETKIKVVLEMGGDRSFRWQPLTETWTAA